MIVNLRDMVLAIPDLRWVVKPTGRKQKVLSESLMTTDGKDTGGRGAVETTASGSVLPKYPFDPTHSFAHP